MKIIKALWKTIRELDMILQLLILSVVCGLIFLIAIIFQLFIIAGVFGLFYCIIISKAFWIMEKEDFEKFVDRVKENMK